MHTSDAHYIAHEYDLGHSQSARSLSHTFLLLLTVPLYLLSLAHPIGARSFTSLGTLGDSAVDMHSDNP